MLQASLVSDDPVDNLQLGLGIELSVLPPYLYTLWSIRPASEGASDAAGVAASAIRGVTYEEMLHAGLVANVLNALGTAPDPTRWTMRYPGPLPGHVTTGPYAYDVGLGPLSTDTIGIFERIEQPDFGVSAETMAANDWTTIPAFYAQVKTQLQALPVGAFSHGDQLPPRDNPGPGQLAAVTDFPSASQAIDEILEQGEGHDPKADPATCEEDDDHEVAHYYQFVSIGNYITGGLIDPARDLYPLVTNPDASRYSAAQQAANQRFNEIYTALLDSLGAALAAPAPTVWGSPTRLMVQLTHAAAVLRGCGFVPGTNQLAGPTFEYLKTAGTRTGGSR